MSRKITVNCGTAIMLREDKGMFEDCERCTINAGSILISSKLQKELNKMGFTLNAGEITSTDINGDIVEVEENYFINENMKFHNCFIVSGGLNNS